MAVADPMEHGSFPSNRCPTSQRQKHRLSVPPRPCFRQAFWTNRAKELRKFAAAKLVRSESKGAGSVAN
jgi:hypothetical protein